MKRLASTVKFAAIAVACACADGSSMGPEVPGLPVPDNRPLTGAIEVTVSTFGADQDADGYAISATSPRNHQFGKIAATGTLLLTGTEAADVSLLIYGLAPNCTLTGDNPRTVKVERGETIKLSYVVNCVASGSLRLTTVTKGVDPDADGFHLFDPDRSAGANISHSFNRGLDVYLPANGATTSSALRPGTYSVGISGVVPNCRLAIPALQTITIVAGVQTSLTIEVTCEEPIEIAFVRGAGREEIIANSDIFVVKSNGTGVRQLTSQAGADINPTWSPDGTRIAFASDRAGNREIYVMNADGSNPLRRTNEGTADYQPAYSPDGRSIAFVSERFGSPDIYVMNADGTNVTRLTTHSAGDLHPAWSPDGDRIAFSRGGHVYVMRRDGSGETQLTFQAENIQPAWSPDGRTIAMLSDAGPYRGIYLMNSDGAFVRRVLGSGYLPSSPDWSPDGSLIAFDDWDCWDNGPCPRGVIIGTLDGLYSIGIDDASEPAWRPTTSSMMSRSQLSPGIPRPKVAAAGMRASRTPE